MTMRGNQFPPRGPRSNHLKIDVSTEERKMYEEYARAISAPTVIEGVKTAMRIEYNRVVRADVPPKIERDA